MGDVSKSVLRISGICCFDSDHCIDTDTYVNVHIYCIDTHVQQFHDQFASRNSHGHPRYPHGGLAQSQ